MKLGKLEISEFVLSFILFIVLIGIIIYASTRVDIEKEKTKQLELQREIEYLQTKGGDNNVK